jgi:hypothetical protein
VDRRVILNYFAAGTVSMLGRSVSGYSRSARHEPAKLLFKSNFGSGVTITGPRVWGSIWAQDITGQDAGFSWPPSFWQGTGVVQELVSSRLDAHSYVRAEIVRVTGRDGRPTRALFQQILRTDSDATQIPYYLTNLVEDGDLFVRYWIKLQPDLASVIGPNFWRVLFEWKTKSDYRFALYVYTDARGTPYWFAHGDNVAGELPYREFWRQSDQRLPVPQGQWFQLEVFWHRSTDPSGRIWASVNGHVIVDHRGPNYGSRGDPIDRIMLTQVYGKAGYYQWVSDIEIWNGFPDSAPRPQ